MSDPDPGGEPPVTPDGRYLVVRGRLWRRADPALPPARRDELVRALMEARRAKGVAMRAGDATAREDARRAVDAAKQALGERGPVWWDDGAPDETRRLARNTRYAAWWAEREKQELVAEILQQRPVIGRLP
ncbi:MAG: hypothetical protein INR65_10170 [Gluconacetobacter diazotrophicus]|nr:hypothetical protein [Gluconacetobacter diazotrophicus]